jgi:hypothetical protein
MFKKVIFVLVALVAFSFASSVEASTGCKKFNFTGSFTRTQLNVDVFGDASVTHSWVYQLNLHSDGSATQYWTGADDFMINTGTAAPWTGSWLCRDDGKLVVSMITANYSPVAAGSNPNVFVQDLSLLAHIRTTYLFSVDNANTLTRLQARSRSYGPTDDPTDPAGGSLGTLNTTPFTYTRSQASDADLNLP